MHNHKVRIPASGAAAYVGFNTGASPTIVSEDINVSTDLTPVTFNAAFLQNSHPQVSYIAADNAFELDPGLYMFNWGLSGDGNQGQINVGDPDGVYSNTLVAYLETFNGATWDRWDLANFPSPNGFPNIRQPVVVYKNGLGIEDPEWNNNISHFVDVPVLTRFRISFKILTNPDPLIQQLATCRVFDARWIIQVLA